MFIKGAPDYLINKAGECLLSNGSRVALTESDRHNIRTRVNDLAARATELLPSATKKNVASSVTTTATSSYS